MSIKNFIEEEKEIIRNLGDDYIGILNLDNSKGYLRIKLYRTENLPIEQRNAKFKNIKGNVAKCLACLRQY